MKCVCKKLSVCLKCVFASRIDFSLNLVPLYTTVSKNAVSVSNVSVVNSVVRWCKLACSMICCFNICHENIGKGIKTAVFVPTAVPWFCR